MRKMQTCVDIEKPGRRFCTYFGMKRFWQKRHKTASVLKSYVRILLKWSTIIDYFNLLCLYRTRAGVLFVWLPPLERQPTGWWLANQRPYHVSTVWITGPGWGVTTVRKNIEKTATFTTKLRNIFKNSWSNFIITGQLLQLFQGVQPEPNWAKKV